VQRAVLPGSTARHCPDIGKLAALGYRRQTMLDQGPVADDPLVLR
jgi:hypothetical protein